VRQAAEIEPVPVTVPAEPESVVKAKAFKEGK
jgi:hypothetical protein